MDPSMQKPVMASHHWSKVIRRIIVVCVIVLIASRVVRHLRPWVEAQYHKAFDTQPPKSEVPSVISSGNTVTGYANLGDGYTVQQNVPPMQLVVKKQSCIFLEAAILTTDAIEVKVVNRCKTSRDYVKLTAKASDSSGIVVKADYDYIAAGEYINVGERRVYQLRFHNPSSAVRIELAVDPGQAPY